MTLDRDSWKLDSFFDQGTHRADSIIGKSEIRNRRRCRCLRDDALSFK